jgi:hypothetical protein
MEIDGVFNFDSDDTCTRFETHVLRSLRENGGRHHVLIEPHSPARSARFNAYYFVALIGPLQRYFLRGGQRLPTQKVHDLLADAILGEDVYDPITKERMGRTRPSTSRMSNKAFGEYFEEACAWVAERCGIIVEEPAYYRTHKWNEEGGVIPKEDAACQ